MMTMASRALLATPWVIRAMMGEYFVIGYWLSTTYT